MENTTLINEMKRYAKMIEEDRDIMEMLSSPGWFKLQDILLAKRDSAANTFIYSTKEPEKELARALVMGIDAIIKITKTKHEQNEKIRTSLKELQDTHGNWINDNSGRPEGL